MNKLRRSEFDTADEQVKVVNNLINVINDLSGRVELLENPPIKKKSVKKGTKK